MRKRSEARGPGRPGQLVQRRPSHSTVAAYMALFIVLGGSAYAVSANSVGSKELKRNAVGKKQIKRNAVAAAELRRNAVRPPQIRRNAVRTQKIADGAVTAAKLATSEWIDIGTPGAPPFPPCDVGTWSNFDTSTHSGAGFLRDSLGFVHLRGNVNCASGPSTQPIFILPGGYRPARTERFATVAGAGGGAFNAIEVDPAGAVKPTLTGGTAASIALDGITFRCAPPGSNGCP